MTFSRISPSAEAENGQHECFCRRSAQYDRMAAEGLGDLDKSGIAELTFKDRHKNERKDDFVEP